jgi:hypothetical protein
MKNELDYIGTPPEHIAVTLNDWTDKPTSIVGTPQGPDTVFNMYKKYSEKTLKETEKERDTRIKLIMLLAKIIWEAENSLHSFEKCHEHYEAIVTNKFSYNKDSHPEITKCMTDTLKIAHRITDNLGEIFDLITKKSEG